MKKVLAIILTLTLVFSSAIIATSAQGSTKIDPQLQEILKTAAPDELVDVYVCTKGYSPNATEMPSWPDMGEARKELKEYYDNWYKNEIVPVVFDGIEYEEVFVGSGIIIVSVKAKDIEKIASYDIVRDLDYFENGVVENETIEVEPKSKIHAKLQEVLETTAPDDFVAIDISTNRYSYNATEMPSWPDMGAARKELKAYYQNIYENDVVRVAFKDIEYYELFVGSGIILVSVKAKDVEKIASYDIVKYIYYFENAEDEVFNESESMNLFERGYKEQYSVFEDYNYDEVYYHYDECGELDWVLVKAQGGPEPLNLGITMDIANVVVCSNAIYSNFRYKYGVYDAVEGKFYDLFDLRSEPDKYDGLSNVLVEQKIGQLIGDIDKDGKITILDATAIQRCLAGLEEYPDNEYYSVYETDDEGRMSDFDRDGGVSVMDATAIQKVVAKYDK